MKFNIPKEWCERMAKDEPAEATTPVGPHNIDYSDGVMTLEKAIKQRDEARAMLLKALEALDMLTAKTDEGARVVPAEDHSCVYENGDGKCAQCSELAEMEKVRLRIDRALLEHGNGADQWLSSHLAARDIYALLAAPTLAGKGSYQQRVAEWMQQAFIPSLYSNMTERGDRLLEEVLELLQSHGYDPARVATLVQYVFGRPAGDPAQEVGGVMVTLAGFCFIAGLDMHDAGETELARITQPEVMAKIRAKQEAKNALHFDTPLPGQIGESEAPSHG